PARRERGLAGRRPEAPWRAGQDRPQARGGRPAARRDRGTEEARLRRAARGVVPRRAEGPRGRAAPRPPAPGPLAPSRGGAGALRRAPLRPGRPRPPALDAPHAGAVAAQAPDRMTARLEAVAEALLLLAVLVAPWMYGGAADAVRYGLAAAVLLAVALSATARAFAGAGLPRLGLPAGALVALGPLQMAVGATAAPQWTAEATLVTAAMMGALVFWSERARDRAAALRLAVAVLAVCAAEAVFGAVQWSLAPDRIYGQATPIVTTPFGSYVNHNHFAGLMEMGVVLAIAMAVGLSRRGGATPGVVGLAGL